MYQRVGTRFGAFNIHHLLGAGGMAAVYYALYADTREPVALKILSPQLAEVQQFRQRFELEGQITQRLDHPNIVPVIAYGSVDRTLYIAMRYLNGGSLHDHFVLQGSVSLRDTARYLRQLSAALDYAHGQGVIHRDLKLANVLLDDEQNVLLSDFGIARLVESSLHLTDSGSVLGSPHYMSPEQSEGKPLDSRSDIYSLSVMVYLMISGQFPFHADTPVAIALQHVSKPPPPPSSLNPALPLAVDGVLLKGLSKAPTDRYSTAAEFAAAFERAIGDCDTNTLIHLPLLSRDQRLVEAPLVSDSNPAPVQMSAVSMSVSAPVLLPYPLQDVPTEPSRPTPRKKRRKVWPYIGLPVLFIILLSAFEIGLTQFGPHIPSIKPTTTDIHSIAILPLTATLLDSATPRTEILPTLTLTPFPSYSVVVKDLYTPANIRSGPGQNYKVIAQLYASDEAEIIARTLTTDDTWFLIRTTQGITGWVSAGVVTLIPTGSDPQNIIPAVTIPPSPIPSNMPLSTTFTPTH